ncbi:MAG TPA: Calx-beta domain-containing protein [Thermoanaerobaculia bacterium]|nr:Calx-beta domain-containing protein [Thermoanaerobaculia bacterium]
MTRLRNTLIWSALALLPAVPALADGAGTLKFDEDSFEVSEEAGVASITIERSQGEDGAVSVRVATGGGTATAGQDYTPVSQTLTWGSGDGSDKTVLIPLLNDSAAEGSETVQLTLSNPTGGAAVSADRGTSVLVILASDGGTGGGGDDNGGGGDDNGGGDDGNRPGTLKFDEREFLAIEGNGNAVITVERSRGEAGTVSVHYATADGTATAGQDYTPASGTLTWGPGDESRRSITIPILDDSASEGSETVRLLLSNPTGGAVLDGERGTAVLRIVENGGFGDDDDDDDGGSRPGTFKFDERSFQVIEGRGSATVVVERSHGERGAVSVRYSTQGLSATAGADFTAVSGTLSWAAGDGRSKTFQIPVSEDNAQEGNETIRVVLSNPTGGALLDAERATATVTILDGDGSTAACQGDDDSLCLLAGRYKVEVVWRLANGQTGSGHMIPASDNSGFVWFFDRDNVEMLLKVLDGCAISNTRWVFFAATTNVDFTVEVTDTATGVTKEYKNPGGNAAAPVQDTFTFPCS